MDNSKITFSFNRSSLQTARLILGLISTDLTRLYNGCCCRHSITSRERGDRARRHISMKSQDGLGARERDPRGRSGRRVGYWWVPTHPYTHACMHACDGERDGKGERGWGGGRGTCSRPSCDGFTSTAGADGSDTFGTAATATTTSHDLTWNLTRSFCHRQPRAQDGSTRTG